MYSALHLKSSFRSISELGFTSKREISVGLAGLIQNGMVWEGGNVSIDCGLWIDYRTSTSERRGSATV
jgi:hypothetical protein